ncbi:MAG: hypothetical protein AAF755_12980 [Pseudomonadota bacterium]
MDVPRNSFYWAAPFRRALGLGKVDQVKAEDFKTGKIARKIVLFEWLWLARRGVNLSKGVGVRDPFDVAALGCSQEPYDCGVVICDGVNIVNAAAGFIG